MLVNLRSRHGMRGAGSMHKRLFFHRAQTTGACTRRCLRSGRCGTPASARSRLRSRRRRRGRRAGRRPARATSACARQRCPRTRGRTCSGPLPGRWPCRGLRPGGRQAPTAPPGWLRCRRRSRERPQPRRPPRRPRRSAQRRRAGPRRRAACPTQRQPACRRTWRPAARPPAASWSCCRAVAARAATRWGCRRRPPCQGRRRRRRAAARGRSRCRRRPGASRRARGREAAGERSTGGRPAGARPRARAWPCRRRRARCCRRWMPRLGRRAHRRLPGSCCRRPTAQHGSADPRRGRSLWRARRSRRLPAYFREAGTGALGCLIVLRSGSAWPTYCPRLGFQQRGTHGLDMTDRCGTAAVGMHVCSAARRRG